MFSWQRAKQTWNSNGSRSSKELEKGDTHTHARTRTQAHTHTHTQSLTHIHTHSRAGARFNFVISWCKPCRGTKTTIRHLVQRSGVLADIWQLPRLEVPNGSILLLHTQNKINFFIWRTYDSFEESIGCSGNFRPFMDPEIPHHVTNRPYWPQNPRKFIWNRLVSLHSGTL